MAIWARLFLLLVLEPQLLCGERTMDPHGLLELDKELGKDGGKKDPAPLPSRSRRLTARGKTHTKERRGTPLRPRKLVKASDKTLTEERAGAQARTEKRGGAAASTRSRSMLEANRSARAKAGTNASVGTPWALFREWPRLEDIKWAQFADSYHLAALAAIVKKHPEVIEDALVHSDIAKGSGLHVFEWEFMVNGVPTSVAVDEKVPMACQRVPEEEGKITHQCTPNKMTWPIILEKGLAKLFGSYMAMSSSWSTLKSLSRAPVDVHMREYPDGDKPEWTNTDDLWTALMVAVEEDFSITALGTAKGDAFVVRSVTKSDEQEVELYNSWAKVEYDGVLSKQNDPSKGKYVMTFEEFTEAFDTVEIARIRKDYSLTSHKVPAGQPAAFYLTVEGSDIVTVQLVAPTTERTVDGCSSPRVDAMTLLVSKDTETGWKEQKSASPYSKYVEIDEPGTYHIYAFASMHDAPWLKDVVFSTYSKEEVELEEFDDPMEIGREVMDLPCVRVTKDLPLARYPNYVVYYKRLPVGKPVALSFTVHGSDPFHVQLEFFKANGCSFELDHAKLMVKRVDDGRSWRASRAPSTTSLRVDLEGPGDYLVYAFSSFHGAVNVCASEPVEFEELASALAVGREILGFPCKALEDPGWISDYYSALPYPVGGSPAWQLKSLLGSTKVIWMDELGKLALAPSENQLNKFFVQFDPSKLKCTKDVKGKVKEKEKLTAPEPDTEEQVNTNCDFAVGERVSYNFDGTWVCSEVEEVYKDSVEVRFHFKGDDTLGCDSWKLMKVPQCEFHEEDRVRYNDIVKGWVNEQIASVECGKVTLSSGKVVGCNEDHRLEYPHGCVFHKDEQVLIWSTPLQRWTVATVVDVEYFEVRVRYLGEKSFTWNNVIFCDSHLLKKLSRCDRRSLNQMTRFKDLDNFDELVDGLEDSLFRPKLESIGPPGADCGDAARGGDPDPCEQYNSWGPISKMLK